jgi:hypothetical protein
MQLLSVGFGCGAPTANAAAAKTALTPLNRLGQDERGLDSLYLALVGFTYS